MTPLRIVLAYASFAAAWVLFSDHALALLVSDPRRRDMAQSVKGAVFVLVTAALLLAMMRRQVAERRALDEQVRAVLDGMADAVLVVDDGRRIVDANRAAAALLGAPHRRDLLVPLDDLLRRLQPRLPDGRPVPGPDTAVARALRGDAFAYEACITALDGRELTVSVSAAPVRGRPEEAPRLAVEVVHDVTELKQFEHAREEFLSTAAHELKTPLAVVKACAQLMQRRGQGDPAVLEVVGRQVDRMARMAQQLLDVSRSRLGGAELQLERFDLGALLAEVAAELQAEARGRLVVDPAPAAVMGDRERIARVISSLLGNAIRFSPGGGDVQATLALRGPDAVVSVRDHGLGIPRERQARIFERYYRAHAGTAHDYGGLGVGLEVSRAIVARHGGRIWFESDPGQGSTFSFSLPLAGPEQA